MEKNCAYCGNPFQAKAITHKYCSGNCRFYASEKCNAESLTGIVTETTNPTQSTMNNTAEFLLQARITELKESVSEIKSEKKTLEEKLDRLRDENASLKVQLQTIEKNHASELSGIEQGKRTLVTELIEVAKSKEAMDGIANLVSSFKGGEKPGSALPESETDELKAVRTIYNAMPPSDQNMFLEMLYVYKQRPDLMTKQHEELKQIVNNQQ